MMCTTSHKWLLRQLLDRISNEEYEKLDIGILNMFMDELERVLSQTKNSKEFFDETVKNATKWL